MMRGLIALALAVGVSSVALAGSVELTGAGATFPYPLYSKMFSDYYKKMGVKVNYQSIGSGAGVNQLINKTVDFGATDAFMSDADIAKAGGGVVHVPTCVGAVVLAIHVAGVTSLELTGNVIADIYLGKITKWNDPAIVKLNPNSSLPAKAIAVAERSDGSGTTAIFTEYLSKVSADWKTKVGTGKSVNWPAGVGQKGNEGVTQYVKNTPNAIGYVEWVYAKQNNMTVASVQNKSGRAIKPSIDAIAAAAGGTVPADMRVSLTDTDAKDGYPISGFTWIIAYANQSYDSRRTAAQAGELVKLLTWMIHDGQAHTKPLEYAPLPKAAVQNTEKIIASLTFNGKPVANVQPAAAKTPAK